MPLDRFGQVGPDRRRLVARAGRAPRRGAIGSGAIGGRSECGFGERQEDRPRVHGVAHLDLDGGHGRRDLDADRVLHLHRLEHDHGVAGGHLVAGGHADRRHGAGEGRPELDWNGHPRILAARRPTDGGADRSRRRIAATDRARPGR